MKTAINMCIVGALAILLSYLSDMISEPPSSSLRDSFKETYDEMADKRLTELEYKKLKEKEQEYFDELTNSANTKDVVKHVISTKIIIIPIFSIIWLMLGLKYGFKDKTNVGIAALLIFILSLSFVNFLEAPFYALVFVIGNVLFLHNLKNKKDALSTDSFSE